MAKKTKAELVEEGKALSSALADVRKTEHSFALYLGADGPAFVVHKTKDPNALRVQAKQESGGSQGAVGKATVDGKLLKLKLAEGESPPAKLGRAFKMHLKQRGIAFKIELLDASGKLLEGDEEDTPATEGEDSTAPTPDPDPGDKDLRQKLEAAFAKMVPLIRDAKTRVSEKQFAALSEQVKIFREALEAEEYPKALAALNNIRSGFVKVTKPEHVTDAPKDESGGVVVADLLEKIGTVNTVVTKIESDPSFFGKAKTQLAALRTSLKTAIASNPSPEDLAKLTKMKEKLDGVFLNDLKTQGHGPQRHEGDVTTKQLTDRSTKGFDPMTGTTVDGVTGGTHKFNRHATRFLDPGDYVDAEITMRESQAFKDEEKRATTAGESRVVVKLPVETVLGTDFAKKLEGVTRDGSVKNLIGSHATNFAGGTMIAIYDKQTDGSVKLVTMYPEPVPTA